MSRVAGLACLSILVLGSATGLSQKDREPEVRVVKYDTLAQEVLKHRGKVIVVDIWFTL
jgi:hypothetical protein